MPSTRVSTGLWAETRSQEVLEAVQAALIEGLKIPETDRDVVLDIYDPSRRIVRPTRTERFTRIEVTLFSGRSLEAKRRLYRALVRNLGARRSGGGGEGGPDRGPGGKLGPEGRPARLGDRSRLRGRGLTPGQPSGFRKTTAAPPAMSAKPIAWFQLSVSPR